MRSKKTNAKDLREMIAATIEIAYFTIDALQKEIASLDIKDWESTDDARKAQVQTLSQFMALVNNVLHPLLGVSKEFLKESEWNNVDYLIGFQNLNREQGIVPKECICFSCAKKD